MRAGPHTLSEAELRGAGIAAPRPRLPSCNTINLGSMYAGGRPAIVLFMRRSVLYLLVVVVLAACGGEESNTAADDGPRVPQGTEEAQAAFESFLSNPFISETQAEEARVMVWQACEAFDQGDAWQAFEDRTIADAAAEGRTMGNLEISGMRSAGGLGIVAYCPEHSDKRP